MLRVNLDGVFLGTKHGIRAMRNGDGESIINVASVSGIKPSAGASADCASKAAVRMFSKTVAIECADAGLGIRVNVVTPGGVKTPMWEQMDFFQYSTRSSFKNLKRSWKSGRSGIVSIIDLPQEFARGLPSHCK